MRGTSSWSLSIAFAFAGPFPSTARAQDAGLADAGGCGALEMRGECMGTVLSYCNEATSTAESFDCTDRYNPTSLCAEVSASVGFRCAEPAGQPCLFMEGSQRVTLFCAGTNAGCMERDFEAECAVGLGACTPADVRTCNGALLTKNCMEGQPYLIDCGSYGAVCDEQACRNVPAGRPCDDNDLFCLPGLTCRFGACLPTSLADAGFMFPDSGARDTGPRDDGAVVSADSGVSGSMDDSSCTCVTANRTTSPESSDPRFGIAFLVVLQLIFAKRSTRRM